MSLLNRLRPKWQNSDPDVRIDAVRQLGKEEVELLTAVAQHDDDPRVRKLAVKKIDAPRVLLEIAQSDDDPGVRDAATQRASQLLVKIACDSRDADESSRALELLSDAAEISAVAEKAHFDSVRETAFSSLNGDAALETFVRKAKDPSLRLRALSGIQSPEALKNVILDDNGGEFASTALARLDDLAALEAIADHGAAPRPIRRQAMSRLLKLVPEDHPIRAKQREKELVELCERVEALERSEPPKPLAIDELGALESAWKELSGKDGPAETLNQRFTLVAERIRERVAKKARSKPAESDAVSQSAGSPPATPATPEGSARAASAHIGVIDSVAALGDEGLAQAIENARNQWSELEPDAALEPRFQAALSKATSRLEQLAKLEQRKQELKELIIEAEAASTSDDVPRADHALTNLTKKWRTLESVADADAKARFAHLEERAHALQETKRRELAAQEQKTLTEIQTCLTKLAELEASDNLSIRESDKALRAAQELLKTMGPLARSVNRKKMRRELTDAREKLFKKAQDARTIEEWKRWANVDIQTGLIARMEALRASKETPKISKEMRTIHEEWKKAGAAPPEKADELWKRYKTTRDELKTRCDKFFGEQKKQRKENLVQKQVLCTEVEALADSEDWNKTADAIKALQEKWKTIGPPPQKLSDAIWQRFRKACDHFFERRKSHFGELKGERDQNLTKKEALCQAAETLQDSTEWRSGVEEFKRLQAEWRTIGAAPRNKSDVVWKRFRKACDHFFDRYKRRDEVELEEQLNQREALVDEVAAFANELPEDLTAITTKAKAFWTSWKQLGAIPDSRHELQERFGKAIADIVERTVASSPDAFANSELDPVTSLKKRERIVTRLEALVNDFAPVAGSTQEVDPLEDLAQRLKDALASNTMTGGKPKDKKLDWRTASQEIKRLQTNWSRCAPVPGDPGVALDERFQAAHKSFRAQKPA